MFFRAGLASGQLKIRQIEQRLSLIMKKPVETS
jgi:hypothetical protein